MRIQAPSGATLLAFAALVLAAIAILANLRTQATATSARDNAAQVTSSLKRVEGQLSTLNSAVKALQPRLGFADGLAAKPVMAAADEKPEPPPPSLPAKPAVQSAAAEPDRTPSVLELVLPKAMFIGTPANIKSRNLDTKKRAPFHAPAGVVNLAAGKAVFCSDTEPVIGEIEMITDGDKEGADGSFVEFAPGLQWVQVDLGASHELHAVVFWHFHSQARVYRDVVVQCSDDPNFVAGVAMLFNNDDDNSAGFGIGNDMEYVDTHEGKLVDARGTRARHVRVYSNGNTSNDMNHMIEVEVYGLP